MGTPVPRDTLTRAAERDLLLLVQAGDALGRWIRANPGKYALGLITAIGGILAGIHIATTFMAVMASCSGAALVYQILKEYSKRQRLTQEIPPEEYIYMPKEMQEPKS